MEDFLAYFRQKKNLANLLFLGILVLALPLAVQIARQQQIIKSKATAETIVFTNAFDLPNNKGKAFKLDDAGKAVVSLEISSPIESNVQTAQSDNILMSLVPQGGLVGTVYAASASDCDSHGGLAGEDDVCDTGQGLKVHVYNCNDGAQLPGSVVGTCDKANSDTCNNGKKKGEVWPECHGCDEGEVTCKGGNDYGWKSIKNPSGNCGPTCATNDCKYRGDPADKYNQCCATGKSQQVTRKKDASGNTCGYDTGACNQDDRACGGTTCQVGEPVSGGAVDRMKAGDYRVDNTIVDKDLKPYAGKGECGYKYYVYQSTLSNGSACVTYNFGAWSDQKACPNGQCTVEWTVSSLKPDPNKDVTVKIKGVKDDGGWQNVDLLVDGGKTGIKGTGMDAGPVFNYTVNSAKAGKHTLSFTTNSGTVTCTPVQEFTTGGAETQCDVDSNLTVTPSAAKVGDKMVFKYFGGSKGEDQSIAGDTWNEGVDPSECKTELDKGQITCTAKSATDKGYWNHKWDNGKQCGSATYKITGGASSVTTVAYRIAESPADFSDTGKYGWKDYTSTPVKDTYEFNDKTPGLKNLWVEFKGSDGKPFGRKNYQIKLLSDDPTITSCSLTFDANNATVLNLTGTNFGTVKSTVKSGDNTLSIKDWKDKSIKAVYSNAPEGEKLPVTVTNDNGQTVEGQCSAITQLSLGAKVFCRTASAQDTDNVDLTLTGDFPGGTKTKQKVKIDKDGNIAGLSQRMEEGQKYKLTLKAPKSVRKAVSFTASAGSVNIPNFVLPIGDIMPVPGGDGVINALDKGELNRQWIIAQDATGRSGDFNGDGRVNSIDWACMIYDFGASDDSEPTAPLATPVPSASPSISTRFDPLDNNPPGWKYYITQSGQYGIKYPSTVQFVIGQSTDLLTKKNTPAINPDSLMQIIWDSNLDTKQNFSFALFSQTVKNTDDLKTLAVTTNPCTAVATPQNQTLDGSQALFFKDISCGQYFMPLLVYTIHNNIFYAFTTYGLGDNSINMPNIEKILSTFRFLN